MAARAQQIERIRDEVSEYFSSRFNIKFVKAVGEGNHGASIYYYKS